MRRIFNAIVEVEKKTVKLSIMLVVGGDGLDAKWSSGMTLAITKTNPTISRNGRAICIHFLIESVICHLLLQINPLLNQLPNMVVPNSTGDSKMSFTLGSDKQGFNFKREMYVYRFIWENCIFQASEWNALRVRPKPLTITGSFLSF